VTYAGYIEAAVTVPAGVTVHATNSGGGPTLVTVPAGSYTGMSAVVTALVAALNSTRTPANWTGSVSLTGTSPTGKVTLNWTGTGTYSITWDSTDLELMLGFTANIAGVTQGVASTGASQMHGLWLPDAPPKVNGDPNAAPPRSDRRAVVTPTGAVYTHVGNIHRRLRQLRYFGVPRSRIWEAVATTPNSSFEMFWTETQLGQQTTSVQWFTPGAKVKIVDIFGVPFGVNRSIAGWYFANPAEMDELQLVHDQWTGLWTVNLGDLVSDG
jgi:hypothetical protein